MVGIHYQGDTAKDKKDLSHAQAFEVCRTVVDAGRVPLLFDWRNQSPLPLSNWRRVPPICTTRQFASRGWGGDAEMNTALIEQCEAFVGIDSGPGKCASATDTPTLIVWTGHHPALYHDPAPNTTHLVPVGFHDMHPVCSNPGVVAWFDRSYQGRHYAGDPVVEVCKWLKEVLK